MDSIHGVVLVFVGFRNVVFLGCSGLPSLFIEQLIVYDLEVVLVMVFDGSDDILVQGIQISLTRIILLRVVKNGKIHVIKGENVMGIGLGILDLVF